MFEKEEILSEIKSHLLLILYFISIGVVVDFIKSLVLSGRKTEKPSISRR